MYEWQQQLQHTDSRRIFYKSKKQREYTKQMPPPTTNQNEFWMLLKLYVEVSLRTLRIFFYNSCSKMRTNARVRVCVCVCVYIFVFSFAYFHRTLCVHILRILNEQCRRGKWNASSQRKSVLPKDILLQLVQSELNRGSCVKVHAVTAVNAKT